MRRREWLLSAAAAPVAAQAIKAGPKNIVISSANGLKACAKAMEVIKAGGDTLEAVVQGVTIVEDDPNDTSVGYGGLPNEEGVVELDASVMHGPTRRAGAVASVRRPGANSSQVVSTPPSASSASCGPQRWGSGRRTANPTCCTPPPVVMQMSWCGKMRRAIAAFSTSWKAMTSASARRA